MPELLTVKEAAAALGCSPATVYQLCSARRLRHTKVGPSRGRIKIPADAITEYLAAGTVPATPTAAPAAARVVKPKLKHLRLPT